MDEQTIDRIFAGGLKDLPPVSSKIVRIFTSSTFTDMLMERNTLMEYVYPKIKEYCREKHGLEFQVKYFYYQREKVVTLIKEVSKYLRKQIHESICFRLWTCVGV